MQQFTSLCIGAVVSSKRLKRVAMYYFVWKISVLLFVLFPRETGRFDRGSRRFP